MSGGLASQPDPGLLLDLRAAVVIGPAVLVGALVAATDGSARPTPPWASPRHGTRSWAAASQVDPHTVPGRRGRRASLVARGQPNPIGQHDVGGVVGGDGGL